MGLSKKCLLLSFAVAVLSLNTVDGRLVFDLSTSDSSDSSEESNLESLDDHRLFSGWPFSSGKKASICDEKCGIPFKANGERIMGGSPATPNQFPWMVHVVVTTPEFLRMRRSVCGATLIKEKFLMTAAHCVYHRKIISISAHLGYHYLNTKVFESTGSELVVPVSSIYIHEDFDPLVMKSDIAILELARSVRFTDRVRPICLVQPDANVPTNDTDAVIAGWGRTEAFGTPLFPQMLLTATVPLVDLKLCQKKLGQIGAFATEETICAGGGSADSCVGDSGGPLMWAGNTSTNSNDTSPAPTRYSQIGITSWGAGCAQKGVPAVYTRTQSYLDWILRITKKDSCLPFAPSSS